MNRWTKFGFNQIKIEEVTEDQSNRVKNICMHSMHSCGLAGCEKKIKMKFIVVMAGTKYGIGSASMKASGNGIKPNLVCVSYIH